MSTRTELERGVGEMLIDEAALQARIAELGEEISAFYARERATRCSSASSRAPCSSCPT